MAHEKMNTSNLLLPVLIFILVFFSILGNAPSKKVYKPEKEQIPQAKILDQMGNPPHWLKKLPVNCQIDGEKCLYLLSYGESRFKDTARENAGKNINMWENRIKKIFLQQFIRARKATGTGKTKTQIFLQKILELLKNKILIPEPLKRGIYWRHVQKPIIKKVKDVDDDFTYKNILAGWQRPIYEYYIKYALPYKAYIKIRERILKQAFRLLQLTPSQKKIIQQILKKLNELDEL